MNKSELWNKKCEPRSLFKSDLMSVMTRSAFAAAEWRAVLALETKEGASILCAGSA